MHQHRARMLSMMLVDIVLCVCAPGRHCTGRCLGPRLNTSIRLRGLCVEHVTTCITGPAPSRTFLPHGCSCSNSRVAKGPDVPQCELGSPALPWSCMQVSADSPIVSRIDRSHKIAAFRPATLHLCAVEPPLTAFLPIEGSLGTYILKSCTAQKEGTFAFAGHPARCLFAMVPVVRAFLAIMSHWAAACGRSGQTARN